MAKPDNPDRVEQLTDAFSITVVGPDGLLGSRLVRAAGAMGREVVSLGRDALDLADTDAVASWVPETDWTVNCAAVTDVDGCEDGKAKESLLVNAVAPELLAAACRRHGRGFVHMGTDYVFYGDGPGGGGDGRYDEGDKTCPRNRYGRHKLAGEVGAAGNGAYVLRTAWLYGPGGGNFVSRSYALGLRRKPLEVDAVGSSTPTAAANLAGYILAVVDADERDSGGLYHCCDEGEATRFEVFGRVRAAMGLSAGEWRIGRGPLFTGGAPRPVRTPLDSSAFFARFDVGQRMFDDSLRDFVERCSENLCN